MPRWSPESSLEQEVEDVLSPFPIKLRSFYVAVFHLRTPGPFANMLSPLGRQANMFVSRGKN